MATDGQESRSGRETRLLLLVVGVSLAVLLLLARWRFPAATRSAVPPSAAPLAELAARATFDEMSSTMADILSRISPSMMVVPIEPPVPERGGRGTGRREPAADVVPSTRLAVGLRVSSSLALVHMTMAELPRPSAEPVPNAVAAFDPDREIALVRLSQPASAPDLFSGAIRSFTGLAYVAVVEALRPGPTIQPVFVGRTETVIDPRWSHPLIVAGPVPGLSPGAFVFSVGGRLIGLVSRRDDAPVIIPAAALETLVAALESQIVTQ